MHSAFQCIRFYSGSILFHCDITFSSFACFSKTCIFRQLPFKKGSFSVLQHGMAMGEIKAAKNQKIQRKHHQPKTATTANNKIKSIKSLCAIVSLTQASAHERGCCVYTWHNIFRCIELSFYALLLIVWCDDEHHRYVLAFCKRITNKKATRTLKEEQKSSA